MKAEQNDVIELYNICHMLHIIIGLDVRFIDFDQKSFFEFIRNRLPEIVEPVRQNVDRNITAFLHEQLEYNFLYYTDGFKLCYIAVGKWENNVFRGTVITGPFLFDIPDEAFISRVIEKNRLPLSSRQLLSNFYKSLTIVDCEKYSYIGHLMVNLLTKSFTSGQIILFDNFRYEINDKEDNEAVTEEPQSNIILRYNLEYELSSAVEKGMKDEALKIYNVFRFNPSGRVPGNPFRAFKNLAYTFNTILRIAAEKGGVYPVYIHNTSDKFAVMIERTSSISELENLQLRMISEYCDLVKKYSTLGYSQIIRKVINFINLNFDSPISLNYVAKNINIHPSHLSRQFKKETGMTVTEFINKKRVEEAKVLIKQGRHSITEISLMVGFENHNYFSSVFKKITKLTPSDYFRRNSGGNK